MAMSVAPGSCHGVGHALPLLRSPARRRGGYAITSSGLPHEDVVRAMADPQ